MRKLFIIILIVAAVVIISFLIVNKSGLFQQKEAITSEQLSSQVTQTELKYKIKQEIRELLDRQIEALEAENIDAFMETIDRSDESLYRKIRQELEFLFSNADILKATSEIQIIELKENNNMVDATILNTLTIKYPDGVTETSGLEENVRYKKVNGEWKELIPTE